MGRAPFVEKGETGQLECVRLLPKMQGCCGALCRGVYAVSRAQKALFSKEGITN